MDLTILLEQRMMLAPNGTVWSSVGYARKFWNRYLEDYSNITICARVIKVDEIPNTAVQVNGNGVSVASLPYYVGPWEFLRQKVAVQRAAINTVKRAEALILRVPSQIGWQVQPFLNKTGRPYGVEVVGDPWDVFAPGSVKTPIRPLFRRLFNYRLIKQCQGAAAALYVTRYSLQKRYPVRNNVFTTYASNVELPEIAFSPIPRKYSEKNSHKLIYIGSFDQLYKGPDVLIKAISLLVKKKYFVQLTMLGDGFYRKEIEALTASLNLRRFVNFMGTVPSGKLVRQQCDQADVLVAPSRGEGLPRALIEAMARGLPCIASNVSGIPELLNEEDMVPPNDHVALAVKIHEVITNPLRMSKMSDRNLKKSRGYSEEILQKRRRAFYATLKNTTYNWISGQT